MKFADVKAEKIRLVEASDDLIKKTNRSWHVHWAENLYPGLRIDVKIETFKWANGEVAVNVGVVAYPRPQGTDPRSAWAMNANELAVLTLARRLVERWVAGELDELPVETPNAITELVRAQLGAQPCMAISRCLDT